MAKVFVKDEIVKAKRRCNSKEIFRVACTTDSGKGKVKLFSSTESFFTDVPFTDVEEIKSLESILPLMIYVDSLVKSIEAQKRLFAMGCFWELSKNSDYLIQECPIYLHIHKHKRMTWADPDYFKNSIEEYKDHYKISFEDFILLTSPSFMYNKKDKNNKLQNGDIVVLVENSNTYPSWKRGDMGKVLYRIPENPDYLKVNMCDFGSGRCIEFIIPENILEKIPNYEKEEEVIILKNTTGVLDADKLVGRIGKVVNDNDDFWIKIEVEGKGKLFHKKNGIAKVKIDNCMRIVNCNFYNENRTNFVSPWNIGIDEYISLPNEEEEMTKVVTKCVYRVTAVNKETEDILISGDLRIAERAEVLIQDVKEELIRADEDKKNSLKNILVNVETVISWNKQVKEEDDDDV